MKNQQMNLNEMEYCENCYERGLALCGRCIHISEAGWAVSEAQTQRKEKEFKSFVKEAKRKFGGFVIE